MKLTLKIFTLFMILISVSCGENEEKEKVSLEDYSSTPKETKAEESTSSAKASETVDFDNKGIGPIKSVDLDDNIDDAMATRGADLFKNMCSACHKMDKKFIGPAISGVTERRSPEWIMNMILNPEQMIKEDPIAKKLLVESNMAVMANQNLEEDEARAILEYFRKYDQEN